MLRHHFKTVGRFINLFVYVYIGEVLVCCSAVVEIRTQLAEVSLLANPCHQA